jgi:hypothetical protein
MEAILSNMLGCDGEFVAPPIAVDGRGGTGASCGAFTPAGTGDGAACASGGVGVGVDRVGWGVLDLIPCVELGRGAQASSSNPLVGLRAGATVCA